MSAVRPATRALGPPALRGVLRATPDDFAVTELPGFEPSGDGPHALLLVEKRGRNTLDVIDALARVAGVRSRDVGYCGLKDRHATTRQWLSVPAERAAGAGDWEGDGWRVVETTRNRRKLRVGAHRGNAFVLRVRDLEGDDTDLDARVRALAAHGAPNYFGPQRFGQDRANLRRARRWFCDGERLGRRQRRFALSAARAWVFNRVLSARVADGSWQHLLEGEPASLDGSRSFFLPEAGADADLAARLAALDIHPSGPLWGAGPAPASADCAARENDALRDLGWVCDGLAAAGLKHERRALRLRVAGLTVQREDAGLILAFTLGRGAFATAVVHELVDVAEGAIPA